MRVLVFFLLISSFIYAQSTVSLVKEEDIHLNLGGRIYGSGTGVTASGIYSFNHWISIGGGFDVNFKADKTFFNVFQKTNLHFTQITGLSNKWDTYLGLDLIIIGEKFFTPYIHLGTRYEFKENFGFCAEIGTNAMLGVYYKIY